MPSFWKGATLSRGDLSLSLSNEFGQAQDGYDVRWTVFRKDGTPSSGLRLPAVRADTGEYFAPWGCSHSTGCHYVKWEFGSSPGSPRFCRTQDFYVLEYSCCRPCCSTASSGPSSPVDCGSFFCGQVLGPDDLRIVVTDDDGLPASAFAVFWTIVDCRGCPVTPRSQASPGVTAGEYYAAWTVACCLGEFSVVWEWMLESDSPMESTCSRFSVVGAPGLFFACGIDVSNRCFPPACLPPPQVIVVNECCEDVEVPRVVHLVTQVLPLAGAFTSQVAYPVPPRVRNIAFYITYARQVPGGFPVIRLMWGNGSEETQATLINQTLVSSGGLVSFQSMRLSDLLGPIPDSDAPVTFMLETSVPGGSTTVRLLAAEGGVVGLPGTAGITLTASS